MPHWGISLIFRDRLEVGRFVQTVLIKDMSHCYDIFGLHHVSVGCRTRAYPSNFAFTIFRSDVQTSSSTYQAFRLRLLRIRRSDFAFIWIRHSDFVFCISGVQTSPSFASDVQTSSASHFLAQQIRHSEFVFCISGVQTSPLYGSDIQTSSASHLLAQQVRHSDFVFCISGV